MVKISFHLLKEILKCAKINIYTIEYSALSTDLQINMFMSILYLNINILQQIDNQTLYVISACNNTWNTVYHHSTPNVNESDILMSQFVFSF